ncbi:hypothetical protein [Aureispira sp. CCB-E]|uniref:hypothetical protein n=1 Tax=Aureispira sp. CCB-E TaxID=3051121 RepID=UPI00286932F8|nr:hypothetical protein [Aureispira sp. CCB-E]WMX14957.1 hypothetical protein QP953_01075 [Aureispira sp. CCB-E]
MSKLLSIPSLVFIAIISFFASCSTTNSSIYIDELTQNPNKNTNNRLEHITNLWVGHFSNKMSIEKGYADTNVEQEIIGRRIWKKNRFGEYWIYSGWFQAGAYESALSSSIAQITKVSPDTAFIAFYRIKDRVEVDAYEWQKDEPFDNLKPSDLENCGEGCGSYLVREKDGSYRAIAKNPCYSPISAELKYYKIDAKLKKTSIVFNTKFLDEQLNVLVHYKDNTFFRFNKSELEKKYENFALAN